MPNGQTALTGARLREVVGQLPDPISIEALDETLRFLARWRSRLLANTYHARQGHVVMSGPFAGMHYPTFATEGALMPRLLGTYECELHPHLARFAAAGVDCVIDVGCAEGYYAIGLARLIPGATVHAYDIDAKAQAACAENARDNGVAERVTVHGAFTPAEFARFAGRRALVICDCEGAEDDLLDPAVSPALAQMRLIVETHDLYRPGVKQRLMARFAATHDIEVVELGPKLLALPDWIRELGHLDQLLAVWEFRAAPTPWLVMTPRG
jgi:precorrin-6B methylase 2